MIAAECVLLVLSRLWNSPLSRVFITCKWVGVYTLLATYPCFAWCFLSRYKKSHVLKLFYLSLSRILEVETAILKYKKNIDIGCLVLKISVYENTIRK